MHRRLVAEGAAFEIVAFPCNQFGGQEPGTAEDIRALADSHDVKFVIASKEDAEEAACAVESYRAGGFTGPVYLMPVGGVESVYSLNNRRVAELAMKMGLRYSDRLQVPLFKNAWGA